MQHATATKVVSIDLIDEDSGEHYKGDFHIKRHSIKDTSAIAVRTTQLNGGLHVGEMGQGIDPETNAFNYMIATLEVSITIAPRWFNINELYSQDLLQALFSEVRAFQATFRTNRKSSSVVQGASTGSEAGSGQNIQVPNGSGQTKEVLSDEVQFTLAP